MKREMMIACILHSLEPYFTPTPYSFTSDLLQPGLAGINLGKFLIKRVITLVKRDMPHISVSTCFYNCMHV